ncbi:MAG: hypothetical protein K8R56_09725 [Candidatus Eisenbacteria bacterium]|nr:hypothetical protein [Candidatus Eisenbacteria bacterium]
MKRLLLKCVALAALTTTAVQAQGVPSPANSTTPACISLVGHTGSATSHALGEFAVTIRDLANNPLPNTAIVIDLSGIPEAVLASEQYDPAMTVDCAHRSVSKLSDATGTARFTIIGASTGGNASTLLGGGKIYYNGILIGSPTVSIYDLDGVGGVGANDLSIWLADFGSAIPWGRCDYDCNGGVGANDFSLWLSAYGSGLMSQSGAPACP